MMKLLSIILMFFGFSTFVFSQTIDLECTYKYIQPLDPHVRLSPSLLNLLGVQNKKWWQFWINKNKTLISIDMENKKVTFGLRELNVFKKIVEIRPDAFLIKIDSSHNPNITQLDSDYIIYRVSGDFYGSKYDPDGSYGYKGKEIWGIQGNCKLINRLF